MTALASLVGWARAVEEGSQSKDDPPVVRSFAHEAKEYGRSPFFATPSLGLCDLECPSTGIWERDHSPSPPEKGIRQAWTSRKRGSRFWEEQAISPPLP